MHGRVFLSLALKLRWLVMLKLLVVEVLLVCAMVGCISGSTTSCIPDGTSIAVSRSNGSGTCPASVVAGATTLNGHEMFTTMKAYSCGVTHFSLNVTFINQDATEDSCMGTDAIMFQDLGSDGGSGSDTMTITCAAGTTCTETFDETWTAQ
jgi:hypothetical protein